VQKIESQKLYRIIDANFNRAKEGLRVCEDICRFVWDKSPSTRQCKNIRHKLTDIVKSLKLMQIIKSRNIEGDVGKSSTHTELKRKDISDIFFANSQRVKESIRVLEEIIKLINKKSAARMKLLRYEVYAFEKKIIKQL